VAKKKAENPADRLRKAYDTVMSFPEGRRVLRHILDECGYAAPLMMLDPVSFEVNQIGSIVNLAKRDIWMEIRKYITPEQQYQLEAPELPDHIEVEEPNDE